MEEKLFELNSNNKNTYSLAVTIGKSREDAALRTRRSQHDGAAYSVPGGLAVGIAIADESMSDGTNPHDPPVYETVAAPLHKG